MKGQFPGFLTGVCCVWLKLVMDLVKEVRMTTRTTYREDSGQSPERSRLLLDPSSWYLILTVFKTKHMGIKVASYTFSCKIMHVLHIKKKTMKDIWSNCCICINKLQDWIGRVLQTVTYWHFSIATSCQGRYERFHQAATTPGTVPIRHEPSGWLHVIDRTLSTVHFLCGDAKHCKKISSVSSYGNTILACIYTV